MENKALEKLKQYLEGKTVISVDPPEASEAICKLTLSDGTAFRLHATDLGFWIEETSASNGKYHSLPALFLDFGHHQYNLEPKFEFDTPPPKVSVKGNTIEVVAADERLFEVEIGRLGEWEQEMCKHPKAPELLASAITLNEMWKIAFSPRNEVCPPELYHPSIDLNDDYYQK